MVDFDDAKEENILAEAHEHEEEDVVRILSDKYGLPYTDLSLIPIDTDALRVVPEERAHEAEVIAFAKAGPHLSLAVHNPNNTALSSLLTDLAARNFVVKQFLVSQKSIDKGRARYAELTYATQSKTGVFDINAETIKNVGEKTTSLASLKSELSAAMEGKTLDRVSRIIEVMLASALAFEASDIHLEPEEKQVRLRLRLDGLLTDIFFFDAATYHLLASRIKLLSGVKLNVQNRAQDGRFSISESDKQIEIRASFIPGSYGESIVLRVLDPSVVKLDINELGINAKLLERLKKEIRRANGLLLTTGPTGSGKSTTLYAFLRDIYTPEIKIITIEDPIEYHLEGIVQTQADEKKYTFAAGLRSIVRQDPDVIMVGEIRDGETADIAIQAALTGHFVFSTVHTNDAAGTFPRLVELGVDPKSFGSAITVAMAQRLLRQLNPSRKKERLLTSAEQKMINRVFSTLTDKSLIPREIKTVWDAVPEGEHTGYKNRMGIHEAIFMDDDLAEYLRDNPPVNEIAKHSAKQGYLTMAQDGIVKALQGLTTLDEVARTIDLPYD